MPRRPPLAALASAWLVLAAAPPPARAQVGGGAGVSARLAWARLPGAEGCPAPDRVRADVAARLGYDPFARPSPTLFVEGRVRPAAPGFAVDLVFRRGDGALIGSRRLDASDCGSLGRAAALAVAVTLDPEAALRVPVAPPDAGAPPPSDAAGGPAPQRRDGEAPPPAPAGAGPDGAPGPVWSASLRLDAAWGATPLRRLGAGPGLAVGVRLPVGLRLGVGGWWLPEQTDDRVGFGVAAGWVEGCAAPALGPALHLAACARLHAGAQLLRVVAEDVVGVEPLGAGEGARFWAAAGAALGLRVSLPAQLFVDVEAAARFGLVRSRTTLVEQVGGATVGTRVYREPPASFACALGLGLRLE